MKKILALMACVWSWTAGAQTLYNYIDLASLINTIFADNTNHLITPATLRTGLLAMTYSAPNLLDGAVSTNEFGHLNNVTSPLQTQLAARELLANKNVPNGYAGLSSAGFIPKVELPNPAFATGTASLAGGTYTSSDANPLWGLASDYSDGYAVALNMLSINSGSELLKLGAGPARGMILADGTAVPSGDIATNGMHYFLFAATPAKWVLLNPASVTAVTSSFALATNKNTVTLSLADGGVTLAKMANLGSGRLIGRGSAGTGVPESIDMGSTLTAAGGVVEVADGSITMAKLANLATTRLIGRSTTGTGVPESIGVGTGLTLAGGVLTAAGSVSVPVFAPPDPTLWADYSFEDFTSGSTTVGGWTGSAFAGSGTASTAGSTEAQQGIFQLSTGASAAGGWQVLRASNSRCIGPSSTNVIEWGLAIPTASDAAESYYVDVGFMDTTGSATDTDAACVRYTHDLNGGNATIHVSSNGVAADTDGGVAIPIGAAYFKIHMQVQPSMIKSWIFTTTTTNALTQVTTGIPSGTTRQLAPGIRISKRAGTTTRQVNIDYVRTWVGYSSQLR